ncbi:MAG TPA: Ig-like domain-containing protein, partial [Pirellulaceae bacterium]|nr:Ig-like domain-containing protein [Pirellulaceae bacterium]
MSKRRAGRLEQLEDRRMMAVIEPVAVNDTYQVGIDQTLNIGGPGVLANDSGSALAAHLFTGPTNGTLALTEDGSFSYTPNPGYSGLDSFLYWATEGDASSMLAAVSITVRAQNDVPVAANDAYSAAEDTPLTGAISVLANDTDPNSDPLTATLVSQPQHGTVVFNSDGTFTYTPNANYHGIDGFSYVASDGITQSEVASATITIASVNDVPVASDDALELNEDTALTITPSMILGNDVDADGTPLTISIVEQPANGQLVLNGDGTYSYTPNPNYYGSDQFTYTANDGTASSNTATVSITIAPVNDAPVANNDEVTIAEDSSLVIDTATLLANDSDADGDTLTLTIVSNPVYGTLVNNGDGTFTYTPNADFADVDGFTYTITDGTEVSSVTTVTINVTPVNDAPVAVGDAFEVDEDSTLVVDLPGILANDTDVDSTSLTATLVDNPLHGELT